MRRTRAISLVASVLSVSLGAPSCDATVEGSGGPRAIDAAIDGPIDAGSPGDATATTDASVDARAAIDATFPDGATEPPPPPPPPSDAGPSLDPCEEVPGGDFGTLSVSGPPTDRPPPEHADLNLELRGWVHAGGTLGLIDIDGPTDELAPRLATMFVDDRVPAFVENHAVRDWDWSCNCRGPVSTALEVTLASMGTAPGEVLEVADSGYDIGDGYDVLVLYVADETITLKYTREDNVVAGYTVHLHGVCVDPRLRALYDASDRAGRRELPALRGNQPFARARGSSIVVAIRDTGSFMDPRSRKDWW